MSSQFLYGVDISHFIGPEIKAYKKNPPPSQFTSLKSQLGLATRCLKEPKRLHTMLSYLILD